MVSSSDDQNKARSKFREWPGPDASILNRLSREGFTGKVIFEQSSAELKEPCGCRGERVPGSSGHMTGSRGPQPGVVLSFGDPWQCQEEVLVFSFGEGMLTSSSRGRPVKLLHLLQCPGQPTTKTRLVQGASSAEVEKPGPVQGGYSAVSLGERGRGMGSETEGASRSCRALSALPKTRPWGRMGTRGEFWAVMIWATGSQAHPSSCVENGL